MPRNAMQKNIFHRPLGRHRRKTGELKQSFPILVAEDDPVSRKILEKTLTKAEYEVVSVENGKKALDTLGKKFFPIILTDWMMPEMDGLQLCRLSRQHRWPGYIYIILLTAKDSKDDIIAGLEAGADDYITKPFSPRVLVARVQAVMRRGRRTGGDGERIQPTIRVRRLSIDPQRFQVSLAGKRLDLTVTEFQILAFLAGRAGWVFTRQQIVEAVRGGEYHVTDRAVDVAIFGLRKKLGEYSGYVETVRGIGYRFLEEPEGGGE